MIKMKTKILYCSCCGERTEHELVAHESMADGMGPVRLIAAVFTLGMTEAFGDFYYKCTCCGNIRLKD